MLVPGPPFEGHQRGPTHRLPPGPVDVKVYAVEVWAQLHLCASDCERIRQFMRESFHVPGSRTVRHMHLTVYHARRPMTGIIPLSEPARVTVAAAETRFMVMVPGGENPRDGIDPAGHKVGFRVHRQSGAMRDILAYRDRLIAQESDKILGKRLPSTARRSAFGARYWQPHVAVLRAGSGVDPDLTKLGLLFRKTMGNLTFDRFVIQVVRFFWE